MVSSKHISKQTKSKQNLEFDNLYITSLLIYNRIQILIELKNLIISFDNYINSIKKPDKDIVIIGIGDSPAILLQIYNKFKTNKIKIKFLPISGIRNSLSKTESNILNNLFNTIYNKLTDKLIVWFDYSSGGGTIINFINNMSIKLYNNSLFYIYGNDINYNLINNIKHKKKQLYTYNTYNILSNTYFGSIIGNSEEYNIRCINKKKLVSSSKSKSKSKSKTQLKEKLLYSISDLPLVYNSNCVEYATFLYKELKNMKLI